MDDEYRGVHKYRLYVYDAEDRPIAPAMVISADNDKTAIEQSENMLDGVSQQRAGVILLLIGSAFFLFSAPNLPPALF
jgi:hypothetical protein